MWFYPFKSVFVQTSKIREERWTLQARYQDEVKMLCAFRMNHSQRAYALCEPILRSSEGDKSVLERVMSLFVWRSLSYDETLHAQEYPPWDIAAWKDLSILEQEIMHLREEEKGIYKAHHFTILQVWEHLMRHQRQLRQSNQTQFEKFLDRDIQELELERHIGLGPGFVVSGLIIPNLWPILYVMS